MLSLQTLQQRREQRSVEMIANNVEIKEIDEATYLVPSQCMHFFSESGKNRNLMCSCPTCSEIRNALLPSSDVKGYVDDFFTQMHFLDLRRHFVNVKYQEIRALETMSNDQILAMLDNDIQTISNIDSFLGQPSELGPRHLRFWRTLFSQANNS